VIFPLVFCGKNGNDGFRRLIIVGPLPTWLKPIMAETIILFTKISAAGEENKFLSFKRK